MANNSFNGKDNITTATMAQINSQSEKHSKLEEELQYIKFQLEVASKRLAQKDQIIGSLEQDLEHMIDQLNKIQHNNTKAHWSECAIASINLDQQAPI